MIWSVHMVTTTTKKSNIFQVIPKEKLIKVNLFTVAVVSAARGCTPFSPTTLKSPLHKINSELIKPFSRFVGKVAIVVQFIYKYLSTHTGAHAPRHVCTHKHRVSSRTS